MSSFNSSLKNNSKDISKEVKDLISLSENLQQKLKELNLPFTDSRIIINKIIIAFREKSKTEQKAINDSLRFYCELCERAIASGITPENNKRFTWLALSLLGFRPPSDLFEEIKDNDCVEIYDSNGTQCYRDINFCKLVSYSVEESLSFPWDKLYYRENSILEFMHKEAGFALTEATGPFASQIPTHECKEISSEALRKYKVKFKTISPLYDEQSNKVAFLVTSNLKIIEEHKNDKI